MKLILISPVKKALYTKGFSPIPGALTVACNKEAHILCPCLHDKSPKGRGSASWFAKKSMNSETKITRIYFYLPLEKQPCNSLVLVSSSVKWTYGNHCELTCLPQGWTNWHTAQTQPTTHFSKYSFIGTQPCSFISVLSKAAFSLRWQSWDATLDTKWPLRLTYILSRPFSSSISLFF